jgi:hypothetical protein
MAVQEMEWEATDWIAEAQNRGRWLGRVNAVMKLRVPSNVGNLLSS